MVARRLATIPPAIKLDDIRQVLDIGSWHLGQSVEFADIFLDARIDAFEPVPDSYRLCLDRLKTVDEQKRRRIQVHNLALTNVKGDVPFFAVDTSVRQKIDAGFSSLFRFNGGLKNSYYNEDLIQKEIKVKADTLDNWCAKNKVPSIDIMWIDVQGAELLVFKGAGKTLKNTRIIMTEVGLKPYYEGHTLKADIDKFLLPLGFKELEGSFELNGFDFEANTIYLKR
jgi:2-O-methyltransferase